MDIFIDDNMRRDWFFISLPLGEEDSLSFDWTLKGHRVLLQRFMGRESAPDGKPTMEWDTLNIRDGKFIGKEHARWYDRGEEDWVNGKRYRVVEEWPLDQAAAKELLRYSLLVRDHVNELGKYTREVESFEKLLSGLKQKYAS